MASVWTLIETCFRDAWRAEELLRDAQARRAIQLDPDAALAGFALWRGDLPARARKASEPRRSRALAVMAVDSR